MELGKDRGHVRGRVVPVRKRLRYVPKEQSLENRGNTLARCRDQESGQRTWFDDLWHHIDGKGDFAGALDYFHRAQQLIPQYPDLLINLAIAENVTKQSAAAEQHFKDALRLAPSFPHSYIYYARYLLSQSRGDEARALLHGALELTPTDLTVSELLKKADLVPLPRNMA